MATHWTTAWMSLPHHASAPSMGAFYIRELKEMTHARAYNEHGTFSNASCGADGTPGKDWVHLEGSTRTYYQSTTPTLRPDGSTALTSYDFGRLWALNTKEGMLAFSGAGFVSSPLIATSQYEKYSNLSVKYFAVSIGSWNMGDDNTKWVILSFSAYPELSQAAVKNTSVIIQSDGGDCWYTFPPKDAWDLATSEISAANTFVVRSTGQLYFYMQRPGALGPSPFFTRFIKTTINRGWVVFQYV